MLRAVFAGWVLALSALIGFWGAWEAYKGSMADLLTMETRAVLRKLGAKPAEPFSLRQWSTAEKALEAGMAWAPMDAQISLGLAYLQLIQSKWQEWPSDAHRQALDMVQYHTQQAQLKRPLLVKEVPKADELSSP